VARTNRAKKLPKRKPPTPDLQPDPQLVFEAERITTGANAHIVRKSLKWYEHWCRVGNQAAAEVSANKLRAEINKARTHKGLL